MALCTGFRRMYSVVSSLFGRMLARTSTGRSTNAHWRPNSERSLVYAYSPIQPLDLCASATVYTHTGDLRSDSKVRCEGAHPLYQRFYWFFVGTPPLSCGRSRKVYVLNAVNTVPSRSWRHVFDFLWSSEVVDPLEPQKCERDIRLTIC